MAWSLVLLLESSSSTKMLGGSAAAAMTPRGCQWCSEGVATSMLLLQETWGYWAANYKSQERHWHWVLTKTFCIPTDTLD